MAESTACKLCGWTPWRSHGICLECNSLYIDCTCICKGCGKSFQVCENQLVAKCFLCQKPWENCRCSHIVDDADEGHLDEDEGHLDEEPCHDCGAPIPHCRCCKKCYEYHSKGDVCRFDDCHEHEDDDDDGRDDFDDYSDTKRCATCRHRMDGSEGWGTFCSRYCYQQTR